MVGVVKKPFSRQAYDLCDGPAKEVLTKLLVGRGHTIINAKENYKVDIHSSKAGIEYFSEAEIKLAWKGDWPEHWEEIRIPERKARLLKLHEKEVLNFYIFRSDMKQCWRIKDSELTPSRLREAKGRNIMKGEKFFHIPVGRAELITV